MPAQEPEHRATPELPKVRTKQLAIVDENGDPVAELSTRLGVVELRIGGTRAGLPCEIALTVGEEEAGVWSAGITLLANGDAVASWTITIAGKQVAVNHFGS
jgi:hypothetical protein